MDVKLWNVQNCVWRGALLLACPSTCTAHSFSYFAPPALLTRSAAFHCAHSSASYLLTPELVGKYEIWCPQIRLIWTIVRRCVGHSGRVRRPLANRIVEWKLISGQSALFSTSFEIFMGAWSWKGRHSFFLACIGEKKTDSGSTF